MSTCGMTLCTSPCHRDDGGPGRYCAPLRCVCGGCAGFVEVAEMPPRVSKSKAEIEALRDEEGTT